MIEFSNNFSFDLEKNLLNSIKILFQKFNKLNKKDILDFTNSMNEYMKKDSILWNIEYNNSFEIKEKNIKELQYILQMCDKEKEQINKINTINDWSKDNSIRKLDELKHNIINKISNIQNDHKKNEYQKKLNKLFKDINEDENEFLKLLKEKINKIIEKGEDLKTNYLKYENYINKFLQNKKEKNKKFEKIIPILIFPNEVEKNENFEDYFIFKSLIWYSKKYHIINKIFEKNINKLEKINYVYEFGEENEYRIIYNFLVYIFFEEEEELSENNINKNIIISTLNSIFIETIYSYIEKNYSNDDIDQISLFLFEAIKGIDNKINDLMKREIIEEKEIKWAYKLLKEIPYNFNIILPKFKYEDIKYLFIRKGYRGKYSLGPLLIDSKINVENCETIFENNGGNKEKNFSDYYYQIISSILKIYKNDNKKLIELNNNIDKKKLKTLLEKNIKDKIIKKFLIFLNFFIYFDNIENYNLKFTDINFINEQDWFYNDIFIQSYPSFHFWCNYNYKFLIENEAFFKFKHDENTIPLFIILIRIISCINHVQYLEKTNNYYDQSINILIDYFKPNHNELYLNNIENLIIPDLNEKIKKKELLVLSLYINKLWTNKNNLNKNILKHITFYEEIIAEKLYKFSLDKDFIDKLFKTNINFDANKLISKENFNYEDLSHYIFEPETFIFQQLIQKKEESSRWDSSHEKIFDELKYKNENLNREIKNFEINIKKVLENKTKSLIETRNTRKKKEYNTKVTRLKLRLENYLKQLEQFKQYNEKDIKVKEYQITLAELYRSFNFFDDKLRTQMEKLKKYKYKNLNI